MCGGQAVGSFETDGGPLGSHVILTLCIGVWERDLCFGEAYNSLRGWHFWESLPLWDPWPLQSEAWFEALDASCGGMLHPRILVDVVCHGYLAHLGSAESSRLNTSTL